MKWIKQLLCHHVWRGMATPGIWPEREHCVKCGMVRVIGGEVR